MRIVAALDADLQETPLGTRSRLADDLHGRPVLRRTVDRLGSARRIETIAVTCPAEQCERVRALLAGTPALVKPRPAHVPPYQGLVRAARKWSLDGWRGGLAGSAWFDEYTPTPVFAALAAELQAEALVVVPPGSALVDPTLTDALIDHYDRIRNEMRMAFAVAPPGLLPVVYSHDILGQLAENNAPPGWALAYKPGKPEMDLAFKSCCYSAPQAVRYANRRLTADTARSFATMSELLASGIETDAEHIAEWLLARADSGLEPRPREVEIELTTADSLPAGLLRPRAPLVPPRGPISLDLVQRLALELGQDDDSLVVLGGHGDPLLHPQFPEVPRILRQHGVYGLTVCTPGQALSDAALGALVAERVDVVLFQFDAWTPPTYARLHGGADLQVARRAFDRLNEARQNARQPVPICLPAFTKCVENVGEMDAFFDGWVSAVGCATITGYSSYGGRLPERGVTDTTPPQRSPCQRLRSRCVVLADGTVSACDQDFAGDLSLGHLAERTLEQIWSGAAAEALRAAHQCGEYDRSPLCAACREWHRP